MNSNISWPSYVFYAQSVVALPLYVAVLTAIRILRRKSTVYKTNFYTLLFQHGIADILAMFMHASLPLRGVDALHDMFLAYQGYYLAAYGFNQTYYFLFVRCFGISMLTLQRFVAVCMYSSKINHKLQRAPSAVVILCYWLLPSLLSLVVLKDYNMYFDEDENMAIIVPKEIIRRNTIMACVVVSTTCLISILTYASIFYFVRSHLISKTMRRELRLSIQLLGMVVCFFFMLVYYIMQFTFAITQSAGPIITTRAFYPIINGLLSYINPFFTVLLNREIARCVYYLLCCKSSKMEEIISISTKTRVQKISQPLPNGPTSF